MSKKKISNNASLALYYTLLAHKAGIILTHLHFLSDNNINNPEENNNIQNNNMSDTKKELSNNLLLTLTPDYPLKPKTAIILVTALSIACIAGSLLIKKGFEYNTHYKEKNHKLEQELQQLSAKNNHIQRLLLEKFGQHTSTKEDHVAHYYQNKKTDALLKKIFSLIPAKSRLKVLDFSITTGSNQLIIAGECREPLQQELFHKKICDHLKSSGELITTQSCSLFMQKESIHFFMTLCFNNTNKNKSKYIS